MNVTTRSTVSMIALTVVATLLMSATAFAALYRVQNTAGVRNVYKISAYSYRAVVGDAGDPNKIIAARDGVTDVFYYSGGQWEMTPFAATGKTYTALTRHHNYSGFYYAANAAGGIDKLVLGWDSDRGRMKLTATPIADASIHTYTALATKASNEEAILSARAGTLDYVYASGGEWYLWENVLGNGRTYTALASSATWGNFYYGIWSGGIDKISFNGYYWAANTIAGTAGKGYTALTNDTVWDNYIYASRSDGGMDKIQEPSITPVGGGAKTFASLSTASTGYHDYMYGTDAPSAPVAMSNRALHDPCAVAYGNVAQVVIWGTVTLIDTNTFRLDDGSGAPVTVVAPDYQYLWDGGFARAQGYIDYSVYPYNFRSWADGILSIY